MQASLADCLACSGCVTSTETVLMEEQHSLSVLRDLLLPPSSAYALSSSSSLDKDSTSKNFTTKNHDRHFDHDDDRYVFVMTISPSSWADLVRHLDDLPPLHDSNRTATTKATTTTTILSRRHQQQQWTSVLYDTLHIQVVMDGNLPLHWSLQEAADEFCRAYRQTKKKQQEQQQQLSFQLHTEDKKDSICTTNNNKDDGRMDQKDERTMIRQHESNTKSPRPPQPQQQQHEEWQRKLWPSQALSRHQLKYRSLETGTIHSVSLSSSSSSDKNNNNDSSITRQRHQQSLPLLSSSCPAVVCLVEKTSHAAVPHLSTTISPMSMAGSFLRHQQVQRQEHQQSTTHENNNNDNHNKKNNNNRNHDKDKDDGNNKHGQVNAMAMSRHDIYHIAVMPCHDKKLEASRKDFQNEANNESDALSSRPDVDIVITTSECLALMQEALQRRQQEQTHKQQGQNGGGEEGTNLRQQVQNALLAPVVYYDVDYLSSNQTLLGATNSGILLAAKEQEEATVQLQAPRQEQGQREQQQQEQPQRVQKGDDNRSTSILPSQSLSSQPFVHGSGGYADFIFRQACWQLFGVKVDKVPWEQATMAYTESTTTTTATTTTRDATTDNNNNSFTNVAEANKNNLVPPFPPSRRPARSARVAAATQRHKEFFQAILYQCHREDDDDDDDEEEEEDGPLPNYYYSLTPSCRRETTSKPVLRFGLAYGMQSLQRVLKPFTTLDSNNKNVNMLSSVFDYVEVMACPSGCLNGGGQIRLSSKETPTETRSRISKTQARFTHPYYVTPITTMTATDDQETKTASPCPIIIPVEAEARHTTYHVVPPMQLSMGAVAGMAVQDLQW